MKNHFEHRGLAQQLTFDPISKQFVSRSVLHPFAGHRDPLELQMLEDLGVDAGLLDRGVLRLAG